MCFSCRSECKSVCLVDTECLIRKSVYSGILIKLNVTKINVQTFGFGAIFLFITSKILILLFDTKRATPL